MNCRFCANGLSKTFVDLESSPPSNSFLTKEMLQVSEPNYPLKVLVCDNCYLVQIDEFKKAEEIFNDEYIYFSSYSKSWLQHAKEYCEMMINRFGFDSTTYIAEIASNDGYLLQYFLEHQMEVLGIEPTANTAAVAQQKGIDTIVDYFGEELAINLSQTKQANLLVGNNVLAHVPDINDFVKGLKIFLANEGIITMEFPHLYQLVKFNQFDTIYHEHFSYLSLTTVCQIFESHGLKIFDVSEIPTHGGSLRVYAMHHDDTSKMIESSVRELLALEQEAGMQELKYYDSFQGVVDTIKDNFLTFLEEQKRVGKMIVGYGAAAKGNTLFNYCGISQELVDYVVDASPHKQNKYLPGSHIPVVSEDHIKSDKPDFILILPWNIKDEIMDQLVYVRDWGGKFVITIPELQLL